jgi:hypothetical protein
MPAHPTAGAPTYNGQGWVEFAWLDKKGPASLDTEMGQRDLHKSPCPTEAIGADTTSKRPLHAAPSDYIRRSSDNRSWIAIDLSNNRLLESSCGFAELSESSLRNEIFGGRLRARHVEDNACDNQQCERYKYVGPVQCQAEARD